MTDSAAPLSFEAFCADLLAPWASDEPIPADAQARSPKAAAKLALYRAALAEGKGTVLVIAPAGELKAVQGYIAAMSESQGMLAGLERRIEVTTAERAPLVRDVVTTIELTGVDAPELVHEPQSTSELAVACLHAASHDAARGNPLPARDLALTLGEKGDFFARMLAAERAREVEWDRHKAITPRLAGSSIAGVPQQSDAPVPADDPRIFGSPAWERQRAANMGLSEMQPARPEVIRSKRTRPFTG
jgi:hypothetical protein